MAVKIDYTKKIENLFAGWQETLIWSCIQKVMGETYADNFDTPKSAMAILGDFCFFAGQPNRELVSFKPKHCSQDFIIMVPQDDIWAKLIEDVYKDKAKKVIRYATKKEENSFDKNKLQKVVFSLGQEYSLQPINQDIFEMCKSNAWSRDLVSQYVDYEGYQKLGLGVAILKDGMIVAGASSYSRYQEGIEIEIDTREDYRRKGLAFICGAKLILECQKKNLYPSWDAQNKWSIALAQKLGYHFDHEYLAYEINGY